MYTYLFQDQDQDQDHPSLLAVLSVPRRCSNRGLKQTTHLFTITYISEAGVPNGMCMGEKILSSEDKLTVSHWLFIMLDQGNFQ